MTSTAERLTAAINVSHLPPSIRFPRFSHIGPQENRDESCDSLASVSWPIDLFFRRLTLDLQHHRYPAKYGFYVSLAFSLLTQVSALSTLQFRYCSNRQPRGFIFYVSFKKAHIYCALFFIVVVTAILIYYSAIAAYPFLFTRLGKNKCSTSCWF